MSTDEFEFSFQQQLENALLEEKAFVIFRKPGEEEVNLFVNQGTGSHRFLMHSFNSEMEKVISTSIPTKILQEKFQAKFRLNLNCAPEFISKTQKEYESLIQFTVDSLQNTELQKVVISRLKVVDNPGFNWGESFAELLKAHPTALVFLWHNPGDETWLGATPELLLKQKANTVHTVSLAGTKLPDAEWTEKEYEEQKIVTDFIVANFSEVQNLEVVGPETVQAGKFQHLKTYISGEIPTGFPTDTLLKKLHPTPALCGMPKKKAFEFIQSNEGYERGFYSGYLGIESDDSKEYFVNLRSAQVFKDKIWIYVGGGITADSNPEKEWMETELKSGTILNSLR